MVLNAMTFFADHDVIYLGVDWNSISKEDKLLLYDFGAFSDDEEGLQIYV